jgi:hypothetical protein
MAHKIGTDSNEDLIGSGIADWLEGRGGNDRLYGKDGNDLLWGGTGNDQLLGGAGMDTMLGGAGDDTYEVDNAGDIVSEETNAGADDGGSDTVKSAISYSLGALIEKLQLTGTSAADGAGNGLANSLKGNDAANVLSGQAGSDTINGGGGDDTLIGGADKDYLTGGAGSDTFVLGPPVPNTTLSKADKIEDFGVDDWLGIYATDYNLREGSGLVVGALDTSYFGAGTAATAIGHGQFVFNSANASLLWDPDGAGGANAIPVATFAAGTVLTAQDFRIMDERPSVAIAPALPGPQPEDAGSVFFTIKLASPAREDVSLTYSTVDGTALGGQDYVAVSAGQVTIAAGSTTAYVKINVLNDNWMENQESFGVRIDSAELATSHQALSITMTTATASLADEGPRVVATHDLAALGIPDPSGLTYDPHSDSLFLSDSEIDETPWFQPTDLWAFGRDGTLRATYSMPFTTEATGLAIDPSSGFMYISDDDQFKVYWVDPANPAVKLGEFATRPLGGDDPEDVAFDPNTGHLFICNGGAPYSRSIVETNVTGTQVYSTLVLPAEIADPEAFAYDSLENVFYVGGGFSDNIWKVARDGTILDVIDVLHKYYHPTFNTRVNVKDIELAPASDGSGEIHLYVADFGSDKATDGRLFEIDIRDTLWPLS